MPGLEKHLISVTLLVVYAAVFSRADSNEADFGKPPIQCYQCHSKYDDSCKHLLVNASSFYKPCEDSEKYMGLTPFCRKIIQKIHGWGGKDVVVRKCGWLRHMDQNCYRVRNWDHSETVCQCFTDGCNLGSTLYRPLLLLMIPLLQTITFLSNKCL